MKIFRYILTLVTLAVVVSCTLTDIDSQVNGAGNGNSIQIVGRIVSFSECDVDTRAAGKNVDESSTQSMLLAVFDSDDNCKDARYSQGSNITFTLTKSDLENGYKLYIFANIANPNLGIENKTLNDYLRVAASVNNITTFPTLEVNGKTEKCLPMIGSYTIVDKDELPALIPIPLEALYAKMVFKIKVDPDQKIEGSDPASFTFDKFEVYNVPTTVDFVDGTPGTTNDTPKVSYTPYSGKLAVGANDFAQGSKEISFSFYLPERFLKPKEAAESYTYPFGKISDLDENDKDRYPQRYKPLLVDSLDAATYVKIYGEFIDHQSHNYKVEYDIYVGNDNYGNFDVERNKQYNNTLTIRGISVSKDEATNDQAISIDHRVNVTRVEPFIINLRRETLLDSHFEVRPLRIRKNPAYTGQETNTSVMVEVIYKDQGDAKWVGIERSFGGKKEKDADGDVYLKSDSLENNRINSAGKRKYFTTGLTDSLQSPIKDIPITKDGETVWIYVDEASTANAKDGVRSAVIRVTYLVNEKPYGDPIDYTICQRELFPVTYGENKYLIEYQEEYLHNYDAEDSYHQTDYEGMPWGLNGQPISAINKKHEAILMEPGSSDNLNEAIYSAVLKINPYYDFYLPEDVVKGYWYFVGDDDYNNLIHNRQGYTFTQEIAQAASIEQCDLATPASSAVQYCLSKNKQGQKDWYLPAIDEMEDIVMSQYGKGQFSYSRFTDFRAKFYWSSQPAYTRVYVDATHSGADRWGVYQSDNIYYARATSVYYNNTTGNGAIDPDNYHQELSGIPWGGHPWSSGNGTFTSDIYCNQYVSGDVDWGLFSGYSYDPGDPVDVKGEEVFSGSNSYGTSLARHKWSHTLKKPTDDVYEPGYKKRTDYARVRCVRKQ